MPFDLSPRYLASLFLCIGVLFHLPTYAVRVNKTIACLRVLEEDEAAQGENLTAEVEEIPIKEGKEPMGVEDGQAKGTKETMANEAEETLTMKVE